MSFNSCTLPVGKNCNISSTRAALKFFTRMGKKGYVTLEHVTLPSVEPKIVWTSRDQGRLQAVLPVFDDETIELSQIMETPQCQVSPLMVGEMFCHGDYFYRTYSNEDGETGIRAVAIFDSEDAVRKACELRHLNVISVELVQMYHSQTNKYLAGAWLVKCLGAPKPYTLIYVDLRDGAKNADVDFAKVWYTTASEGRKFTANRTWYELKKDAVDRLYIVKAPMCLRRR